MTAFNYLMGICGLMLAGDSFGTGARTKNIKIFALGCIECMAGLYFIIAAIGG